MFDAIVDFFAVTEIGHNVFGVHRMQWLWVIEGMNN